MSLTVDVLKAAGVVALAGLLSSAAFAQQSSLPTQIAPDGQEACFGRVYDAAHMAKHPRQKIARIFFFYGDSPVPHAIEEAPDPADAGSSGYNGYLATTVRGAKKPEWAGAWCSGGDPENGGTPGEFHCGMECDRSMGTLKIDASGSMTVTGLPRDLYLDAGSEEEMTPGEYDRAQFGDDDDNFRLDPLPVERCKAEFANISPPDPALGEPLRVRLKPDQPFCYGRDYDAAHLAGHTMQVTKSIRVMRGPAEIANFAGKDANFWPDEAEITVSVTTRKSGTATTQSYSCGGQGDQWACYVTGPVVQQCAASGDRQIYLRRGADGTMMLANPNNAVPIVDMCASDWETQSDDKTFRLDPMPLAQCGL